MKVALSAVFALAAAGLFGASTVLQQAAAARESDIPFLGASVLRRLIHRPRWLAALVLSGVSFGVQALALAFGPLVLVLPISATDLLFALPFLAHLRGVKLRLADWSAACLVAGGIATFISLCGRGDGRVEPRLSSWLLVAAGVSLSLAVMVPAAGRTGPVARTALLAGSGAVVFAMVDALSKAFVGSIAAHGAAALLRPEPYGLLLAGLGGIVLAQGAYRSGSLLVSLPIIDTIEPIGGVLIGVTAFGEHLASSPVALGFQLAAAVAAVAGIVLLDRSPLIFST